MNKFSLKKIIFLSILVASAVLLNSFDIAVTLPIPYMKLGVAHIISILVLFLFGKKELVFVVLYKVIISSLIWGKLFTPVFFISLVGNIFSIIFLVLGYKFFSIIPLSIGASFFNNIGQSVVVYVIFINNKTVFSIFGFMFLVGILTGAFIGFIAKIIINKIDIKMIGDF